MSNSRNPDALIVAEQWVVAGKTVALATVTETWASAPLPTGSQMAIDADGAVHGSLSSGCVEGEVAAAAMEVIASGRARLLNFGVSDEMARGVGLACGGRIQIYVERIA